MILFYLMLKFYLPTAFSFTTDSCWTKEKRLSDEK